MGESFIGLTGTDGARESKPEPGVSSDMRAARPENICGSSSLNRPSTAFSSPGSVASLFYYYHHCQSTANQHKRRRKIGNVHALQGRQHKETIAERVVLCHLIQSVARIVCVDSTSKDWVICYSRTEHAA